MIPNASNADTAIENDPRWLAVQARDRAADGRFFYSVETTGVYCRPSCPSRRPRRCNVSFHATAREAERAGFRPCKRCRPEEPPPADQEASQVAALCRWIEQQPVAPTLAALAARSGWSSFHTHRLFKRVTGLTPKAYAAAHRAQRLRDSLESSPSITRAIYDAGYGSPARFYEQSAEVLGMTPTEYQRGGREQNIRFALRECSLGCLLVAATEIGVCSISLGDDPEALTRALRQRFPHAASLVGDTDFDALVARVVELVERPWESIELPLDVRGTAFQKRVWQALREVRAGSTVSYAELARAVGRPDAVRAVAGACAANSLAVAIPCHRVLRGDGALSGYRWGVERKRALLARERR